MTSPHNNFLSEGRLHFINFLIAATIAIISIRIEIETIIKTKTPMLL